MVMRNIFGRPQAQKIVFGVVLLACAAIGTWALLVSHAATTAISTEPENGTVTAPANITTDSTASNGKAIRFNAPASSSDPYILAAGDISTSTTTGNSKTTSDIILSMKPTNVLILGDSQYDEGALSAYNSYFNPTWGRFKSIIRPAPGHHDYYTDTKATGYYSYYGAAANNASQPNCTSGCEGYYSFNIGNWHLIALNTNHQGNGPALNICLYIACNATSAQVAWLKQDLAANTKPCVLAYWSDPRFASGTKHGSNPNVGPIWDALYAGHVDLALNGHEHYYERFGKQNPSGQADPKGIREIISGTGGNVLYPFGPTIANDEVRNDTTHGVTQIVLHPDSYDWKFIPADGTFTDSGSAACNQ